jgi:hypothetical protein
LNECGDLLHKPPLGVPDAVKVINSQKKLQALDFWVRNPDYLAHELINQYRSRKDESLLDAAETVMAGNEPELRRLGMLRFYFGAFESIVDTVASLKMLGLADLTRKISGNPPTIKQRDYYLLKAGEEKAAELAQDPILKWYAERAALVGRVANQRSGAVLKKEQHKVASYHNARWGEIIAPITNEVRGELAKAKAEL